MKDPNKINSVEALNWFENMSDEELVDLKNQAVDAEDYLRAHEIKQELNMRKRLQLEREEQDEKSQRKEKIKSLNDSLQQEENNEKLTEIVEISDEELESSIDLVEKIQYINHFYEWAERYDEDIKHLKSFDAIQRKKYFKDHEISSKLDFQKYVLKLCRKYLDNLCELKKRQIAVDLDNITDAQKCLNYYKKYLDLESNDEISSLFNPISIFLEEFWQAIQSYLDTDLNF